MAEQEPENKEENSIPQATENDALQDQIAITNPALNEFTQAVLSVRSEMQKVIVGQTEIVDLFLVALLTGGHLLLEGVPGIAKTLTAKLFARTIDSQYSRIQFTPDLMPSDVIGSSVFNIKTSDFSFNKGPIFANVVLIDEINRSPAKTQAALFEVMEERQITVDGLTHNMESPFIVLATQNPIEQEGTYSLPEAQLDRFLFKVKMEYPSLEEEKNILKRFSIDFQMKVSDSVKSVLTPKKIKEYQKLIENTHIKDQLLDYIAELIYNTRNNGDLFLGASPRASLAIMKASKAIAAMRGRDFVVPEDIKYVIKPILNHRIILTAEKEMEGLETLDVIDDIISTVEVPR